MLWHVFVLWRISALPVNMMWTNHDLQVRMGPVTTARLYPDSLLW